VNRRGFTLIEMVMIIAVGSIVVGGMVLFSAQHARQSVQMRDQVVSIYLAQRYMAESNNVAFAALPPATTNFAADAAFGGFRARRIVTALATSGTNVLRQVEIQVARTADAAFAAPVARLWTYRQSNVTYGTGT